ncbi:MAG: late competence development ComFB family protein [Candidatus Omnitrophica bacterium]|nr:late competence development ComFB family protein [Candidatus Omnitrophota bacterium]
MTKTVKQSQQNRLTNYMEELAHQALEGLLAGEKRFRFSDGVKADIKALALNRLWPMYMTTESGREFFRKAIVEENIEKDIVRELRAAISIVQSNRRKR